MTATQFTDDAYNKLVKGHEAGNGTLVGNWYEEVCQREGTGEGRTIPQRHIRRSGLLKDFTRVPTDGQRVQDNTFERMMGYRKLELASSSAAEVGKTDGLCHVTELNKEPVQASLRLPQVGIKEIRDRTEFYAHAKEFVTAKEDAIDALRQRRELETTTATAYTMPPRQELNSKGRSSGRQELLSGPPLPESEVFAKRGVDFDKLAHYTLQEAVTANTEFVSNPETRAAINMTPMINGFRRDFTFSVPTERFIKGPEKDSAEPPRHAPTVPMSQIQVVENPHPVSLVDVKRAIGAKFTAAHGPMGFVELRRELLDAAVDGCVALKDAEPILTPGGLPTSYAVKAYLTQMASMAKDRVQVGKIMVSLRPVVPNASLQMIASLYEVLPAADGVVDMGAWSAAAPAGALDQMSEILGLASTLTKDLLYEYLSDIAVAMEPEDFAAYVSSLAPQ